MTKTSTTHKHPKNQAEFAQLINDSVKGLWLEYSDTAKADFVILFYERWFDFTKITTNQLDAAMRCMPYWAQGASNYLDMLHALHAALAAK